MAVGKFHLPVSSGNSGGNLEPTPYVRPADWLPIDNLVSVGQQKFVGLIAVMEEGNFVTIQAQGAFTVDWGDGTIINYTSNTIANHQHNYSSFVGTECSRGYRQAIVTVTPQAGQNLTHLYLHQRHSSALVNYTNRWLDIKMSAPNMTTIQVSSGNILACRMLEQFDFVGTHNITSFNTVFYNCVRLRKIKNFYTNNATSMSSTFFSCTTLEEVDFLVANGSTLGNVTDFSSTFQGCVDLKRIPNINMSKGASFSNTFNQCVSIVEFPPLNCFLGTNFTSMFNQCFSMLKNPTIITDVNKTKNFQNMFTNCYSMEEFVDFNTQRSNNYSGMFQNCYNLKTMPTVFKTNQLVTFVTNSMFASCNKLLRAPEMDLTTSTTTGAMFSSCFSLEYVPDYIFGGTNMFGMFSSCSNLKKIPNITFLSGAGTINMGSCFNGCNSLEEAPNWDMSKAFEVQNMFNLNFKILRCPAWNLSNVTATSSFGGGGMFLNNNSMYKNDCFGMRYTISFGNCNLSRNELVKIFNNLGTAVGAQTITISGNYGASTLTAPERAIATGKGWTIVG